MVPVSAFMELKKVSRVGRDSCILLEQIETAHFNIQEAIVETYQVNTRGGRMNTLITLNTGGDRVNTLTG